MNISYLGLCFMKFSNLATLLSSIRSLTFPHEKLRHPNLPSSSPNSPGTRRHICRTPQRTHPLGQPFFQRLSQTAIPQRLEDGHRKPHGSYAKSATVHKRTEFYSIKMRVWRTALLFPTSWPRNRIEASKEGKSSAVKFGVKVPDIPPLKRCNVER